MDVIGDYATQTLFSLAGPGLAVDQQRARSGEHAALAESEHGLRVFFESEDGFRPFAPARLPSHDSAFAMTVHKSQGSEFAEVLLALPEQPSPLLSRSLFYTGITRAKGKVEIWGLPPRLAEAVGTRAERAAGLAERLARDSLETPALGAAGQLDLF